VGTYEFAREIARAAYGAGAGFVDIRVVDNELLKARLELGAEESLDYVPNSVISDSYQQLAEDWARIRIDSTEDLDALKGVDSSKLSRVTKAMRGAQAVYLDAMMRHKHQWLVIAAPGPRWAQKVFGGPEVGIDQDLDQERTQRLWQELIKILRLDTPDPVETWEQIAKTLKIRGKKLDDMHLDYLHFSGPGTDLKVALTQTSFWAGGPSATPEGRVFEPNLPTEEVFTTPDFRRTNGRVTCTRPVKVLETLVYGAWFEFSEGKVVDFGAEQGREILEKYLAIDDGAGQLGEVALVDASSPIYQSGLLFNSILYDENASCHIALGAGYPFCLRNANELNSPAQLKTAGCNVSMVHTDFMIGSPEVDVTGVDRQGKQYEIIRKGSFVL
jgi:aminopeptidase